MSGAPAKKWEPYVGYDPKKSTARAVSTETPSGIAKTKTDSLTSTPAKSWSPPIGIYRLRTYTYCICTYTYCTSTYIYIICIVYILYTYILCIHVYMHICTYRICPQWFQACTSCRIEEVDPSNLSGAPPLYLFPSLASLPPTVRAWRLDRT